MSNIIVKKNKLQKMQKQVTVQYFRPILSVLAPDLHSSPNSKKQ
jgi:hypothetical protein